MSMNPGMLKGLVGRLRRSRSSTRPPTKKTAEAPKDPLLESIQRIVDKCENENLPTTPLRPEDACCVCMERVASVTAYPCAHKVTCRKCTALLIKDANAHDRTQLQCIICRTTISKFRYCKPLAQITVKTTPTAPYELHFRHPSECSGSFSSSCSNQSISIPKGLLAGPSRLPVDQSPCR